jgi:anti-sigma regulatory factor (Ser/Thr protein kinase)
VSGAAAGRTRKSRLVEVSPAESSDTRPVETLSAITADRCIHVRHRVAAAARRAGLTEDAAARFTLAVNEILINAIQHGGGTADVSIIADATRVVVEVRDHGPGMRGRVPDAPPPVDSLHGRGLWLARQLCDDVSIHSTGTGVTVRLGAAE